MFHKTILAAALAASTGSAAFAWDASVQGPDVFGVTKVIASEGGAREGLVVQCDSKDQLHLALIMRKKEFEDVADAPAKLLVQVNKQPPFELDATLREWNDNYAGVVATGRDASLVEVVKGIESASGPINVGFEAFGNQASASFGSRGSTAAMRKVVSHCGLENIAAPPM